MALADYINSKPTIETDRLKLRPMTVSDVAALKEWLPNPSIYAYWGKGPSKAEKNPELLFEKAEKPTKSFHLGIEEKASGKVIGDLYVYLIENDRMASVAIRISPFLSGTGIRNRSTCRYDKILLFKHGVEKIVDRSRCKKHSVTKNAGKMRLHERRVDPPGENGQYVVRLLYLRHSCVGYAVKVGDPESNNGQKEIACEQRLHSFLCGRK